MNVDKLIPQKINFNKSISNHQILLNANILERNILVYVFELQMFLKWTSNFKNSLKLYVLLATK